MANVVRSLRFFQGHNLKVYLLESKFGNAKKATFKKSCDDEKSNLTQVDLPEVLRHSPRTAEVDPPLAVALGAGEQVVCLCAATFFLLWLGLLVAAGVVQSDALGLGYDLRVGKA